MGSDFLDSPAGILILSFGALLLIFLLICCFIWCCYWTNKGCGGILHCCRRAKKRRETHRQDQRSRRLQQDQERAERRYEQEIDRRQRRQNREWNASRGRLHRAQPLEESVIQAPARAHIALSAVPSDHLFNDKSRVPTLGRSAGAQSNYQGHSHTSAASRQGQDTFDRTRDTAPLLPSDSISQVGRPGRNRIQRRPNHDLTGWAQGNPSPMLRGSLDSDVTLAPSRTVASPHHLI